VIDRNSRPSITRSMLGTKLITQLLPQGQQDRAEPSTPRRTVRTR
jgi:hypothetical protein